MKNFPFKHNGQELWYSRSLACANVILRYDSADQTVEVLAVKRGQGCEFNKGKWNVPGGFIDFDEDAKQCVIRETFEETGISLPSNQVMFQVLDTEPVGQRQTMIAVHSAVFPKLTTKDWKFSTENAEPNEVEEIKWIDLKDLNKYNWCRGQIENIKKVTKRLDWIFNIINKEECKYFV